jgi:predicted nucleic acid-binding protein
MVGIDLKGKKIFLDTAPIIYFIEGNSPYQGVLAKIFQLSDLGFITLLTSTITLLEVLVKPLRENNIDLTEKYRNILVNAPGITLISIDSIIATKAAELRANFSLKTPDSQQLAISSECNCDYFLTNDTRLKSVSSVNSLVLSEL